MDRIEEPELMTSVEQVSAYAAADFNQPHELFIERFKQSFPDLSGTFKAIELGCGPGDIVMRFARAYPLAHVSGIDGSTSMIAHGRELVAMAGLRERISLHVCMLQSPQIRALVNGHDVVLSNALLHHLHDPAVLWDVIALHSTSGTRFFIQDLLRPRDPAAAHAIVQEHSRNEPEVLKTDFFNSLCAAFTVEEVQAQVVGLPWLRVEKADDYHLKVWGTRP
jgi:cyclopropane fatty-acyl-phospholipid synthase-like methyltransferase